MTKYMKKLTAFVLAFCMMAGFANICAFATEDETKPPITVDLVPGKQTDAGSSVTNEENTTVRIVTAKASELTTVVNKLATSGFQGPQSALKFDRNSTDDQTAQRKIRDLYTDNGHFTDPKSITVTDAPEGYPFKYVGTGDYSGHYVSHIRVIYKRDEAGNPVKDENGNYVIEQLQHSNGTPLTYKGVPTTDLDGPFDQTTGTRPLQFLLMNEAGDTMYGYCIDVETGAESATWYRVVNLEDANYYASQEAEDHIRAITQNGYWGTESGMGSLASLKEALKKAVADGTVETEYEISFAHRKDYKEGYELQEGEIVIGTRVYWYTTEDIVLTNEVIDGLTEGEALDAMQCAIWSYANGSNHALDGTNRMIVGDVTYASSALGDSRNGQNDYAGAARTKALYNYLINLETEAQSTIVINEKNFIKDMALTVGSKNADGSYNVALKFTTFFDANVEKDDLTIALTYVDANGETKTITEKLTGENALLADENGYYTLEGLLLKAGQPFNFALNVYGAQFLEKGTYLYMAEGGFGASQSMVGIAEGTHIVDVTASVNAVFEVEEYEFPPLEGEKKAEVVDREEDRYKVSIEVPGGDATVKHDEIILMVDGSYSMDEEWPAMKKAIIAIGEAVLDGSGHTQLTLMAFGMADNIVLEHVKTVDELTAALGELPGNLLYGRSSTNCEAGFTGVAEYIAAHDATLGKVEVIFISDGNVNTDETPRVFDTNWKTWATKFGALTVAQAAFEGAVSYGENLPAAFTTVFGDRFAVCQTREEILNAAFAEEGGLTDEEFLKFADQVWADVYAYSGLTSGAEYPVSDAERAFVKYDKENGTYIQDAFYYTTYKSSFVTYPDRWARTPKAADQLAAMEQVNALYVVDYDSYTAWMDTGITSEKSNFIQSNGIAGLVEALQETLSELAKTPYNNVVITDYMSKWVDLDPETIQIVDVSTNTVIWTVKDGWLIEEALRPTAKETPVLVELVDPADYEDGGEDVIGNTSGDIYKLTWYVKDGALLRSDNYRIEYEVTVDTAEEGFEDDVNYPANGTTTLAYNDYVGELRLIDIEVPVVSAGTTIIDDEDSPESDLPETGDMSIVAMATALVSMMALVTVVTLGKKKENI